MILVQAMSYIVPIMDNRESSTIGGEEGMDEEEEEEALVP
jgi:hypothetical protein